MSIGIEDDCIEPHVLVRHAARVDYDATRRFLKREMALFQADKGSG